MRVDCANKELYLGIFMFLFLIFLSFLVVGQEEVGDIVENDQRVVLNDGFLEIELDVIGQAAIDNDSDESTEKESFDEPESFVEDEGSEEPVDAFYVELDELVDKEAVKSGSGSSGSTGDSEEKIVDSVRESSDTDDNTNYVFYNDNKKEMETSLKGVLDVNIYKEEFIEQIEDGWKKRVKVYSEEDHFDNPIKVYSDVSEELEGDIRIYWIEEDKYLEFDSYDEDGDGLIDRVSWIVPHLSEQNFEIIIDLLFNEDLETSEIIIEELNVPSGTVTEPSVSFSFNVSYFDVSFVLCGLDLRESGGGFTAIYENLSAGQVSHTASVENGNYLWELYCRDTNNSSVESSASGNFLVEVDYTPSIEFSADQTNVNEDDPVNFIVDITTVVESSVIYVLDLGDGDTLFNPAEVTDSIYEEIEHIYDEPGDYDVTLSVYVDGGATPYERTESVNVSQVSAEDNSSPTVTLIDPEDDEEITNEEIIFKYKASDNARVENCTFSLYYYNDSSLFGREVYTNFNDDIINNEEVSLELIDFDEGDYSWDVGCYDNSTNYKERGRDFSVIYPENIASSSSQNNVGVEEENDFEEKDEINDLVSSINDFLVKEEKYSREEKEAVEDLRIIEDLKFYKKKLLQMELDLGHNLDYIRGDDKREERRQEILDEIDSITESLPVDISVIKSNEYLKNSFDLDIEEVVRAYAESGGLVLNDRGIRNMAEQNEKIQSYITVPVKVKQLEIDYFNDKTKELTLVTKTVEFKNTSFDSIMEVIPKEVAESSEEVHFINDHKVIKEDPIFEIEIGDLKDDKIVYYIEKLIDFSEIEKTTTFSFKEEVPKNTLGAVTGFATFVGIGESRGFWFYASWALVAVAVLSFIVVIPRKARIRKWKKQEKVRDLFSAVKETKKALKDKDLDKAKTSYREAREIYPEIPKKCKGYVYKRIEELQFEIDKKDAGSLIKEFLSVAKTGTKEDALLVYDKISSIYDRMPDKYKRKVYEKVRPVVKSLNKN